jgi:hypothetical protein
MPSRSREGLAKRLVGPRADRGVIYDFIMKLREDRRWLEVLGAMAQRFDDSKGLFR